MKQFKVIFSFILFSLLFNASSIAQNKTIRVTLVAIECDKAPNVNSGGDRNIAALKGVCSSKITNSSSSLKYIWKTNSDYDYARIPIGGRLNIGQTVEYKLTPSQQNSSLRLEISGLHLLETDRYQNDNYAIADNFGNRAKTLTLKIADITNNSEQVIMHTSSKSKLKFIFKFEVITPKILTIQKPKTINPSTRPNSNGKITKEPIKIPNSNKIKKKN